MKTILITVITVAALVLIPAVGAEAKSKPTAKAAPAYSWAMPKQALPYCPKHP